MLAIDFSRYASSNFVYKPPETIIPIENKSTISHTTKDKIWSKLIQGIGANFLSLITWTNNLASSTSATRETQKNMFMVGQLHYHFSNLRGNWDYIFPANKKDGAIFNND